MERIVVSEDKSMTDNMNTSSLLELASQAEKRVDAMLTIRNTAIKLTNGHDWVDQNGKPYLQASGAEKIAGAFGMSWAFLRPEPIYEEDLDGHYTYTYQGKFEMSGRSIQIDGSRSSRDPFFKEYYYVDNVKTERPLIERTNKRDVKMAALTNLLGNGITRMLGIRNLTYQDLEEFAGIKKTDIGSVTYKNSKPAVKATQSKSSKSSETGIKSGKAGKLPTDEVMTKIDRVALEKGINAKTGKDWTKYIIHSVGGTEYGTFSETFAEQAKSIQKSDTEALIGYTIHEKFGNTIEIFEIQEAS